MKLEKPGEGSASEWFDPTRCPEPSKDPHLYRCYGDLWEYNTVQCTRVFINLSSDRTL